MRVHANECMTCTWVHAAVCVHLLAYKREIESVVARDGGTHMLTYSDGDLKASRKIANYKFISTFEYVFYFIDQVIAFTPFCTFSSKVCSELFSI